MEAQKQKRHPSGTQQTVVRLAISVKPYIANTDIKKYDQNLICNGIVE